MGIIYYLCSEQFNDTKIQILHRKQPSCYNKMNPIEIIEKYYDPNSRLYNILLTHSTQVRDKALQVATSHPELHADIAFIAEAAMLHDIGIYLTYAPDIDCFGTHKYVEHGYLGAELISKEGFPRHALVCERHTGMGLDIEQIERQNIPIPRREMRPVSIEEKIICYADKFFSKSTLHETLTMDKIIKLLNKYDQNAGALFLEWHAAWG